MGDGGAGVTYLDVLELVVITAFALPFIALFVGIAVWIAWGFWHTR